MSLPIPRERLLRELNPALVNLKPEWARGMLTAANYLDSVFLYNQVDSMYLLGDALLFKFNLLTGRQLRKHPLNTKAPTVKLKLPKIAKFNATSEEFKLISKIAKRAIKMSKKNGVDYELRDCEMDITACHCNGCPLDLKKFLAAPDADFGHDLFGIRRFINRMTGEIDGPFHPRCGAHQ